MANKELEILELKAELFDLRNEGERIQQEYNQKMQQLQQLMKENEL